MSTMFGWKLVKLKITDSASSVINNNKKTMILTRREWSKNGLKRAIVEWITKATKQRKKNIRGYFDGEA